MNFLLGRFPCPYPYPFWEGFFSGFLFSLFTPRGAFAGGPSSMHPSRSLLRGAGGFLIFFAQQAEASDFWLLEGVRGPRAPLPLMLKMPFDLPVVWTLDSTVSVESVAVVRMII